MRITILCVGKLKEIFYREAVEEYAKRLSRYCRLEIIEVADEKTPDKASAALEEQIREREETACSPVWRREPGSVRWRFRESDIPPRNSRRSLSGQGLADRVISHL